MANPWNDDYIAHYGVPGMKWGRRKSYGALGRMATATGKTIKSTGAAISKKRQNAKNAKRSRIATEAHRQVQAVTGNTATRQVTMKEAAKRSSQREKDWNKVYLSRSKLSSDDLKKAIQRLELENKMAKQVKTAAELTAPEKSATQKTIARARNIVVVSSAVAPAIMKAFPETGKNPNVKMAVETLDAVSKLLKKDKE